MDSNPGSLVLEATALPAVMQPLSFKLNLPIAGQNNL